MISTATSQQGGTHHILPTCLFVHPYLTVIVIHPCISLRVCSTWFDPFLDWEGTFGDGCFLPPYLPLFPVLVVG